MSAVRPEKPLVLLLRSGPRTTREYLLRSMVSEYRVHLFTGLEPTWELEYIDGYTVLETRTNEETLAGALAVHERDPISGVITWDEARVNQTAYVAEQLGLPGPGTAAALACRDKNLTRTLLAAAGVPQPASVLVGSLEEARAAAERIGYPVIVKPSDLLLSMGVVVVPRPEDLDTAYATAVGVEVPGRDDYECHPLVEEFVSGYEISVDSAVHEGEVTVLCIARKQVSPPPHRVEVGHVVDPEDPLLTDEELFAVVRAAHAALGFRSGNTHTEIMMTADGPKIIEVNGRLGGDLIPYLGLRATGVDTGLASTHVVTGRAPQPVVDRKLVAGVRFFWVAEDNTVLERVYFDEAALPPQIDIAFAHFTPGEIRHRPRGVYGGRIATATVLTETVAECHAALDAAEAALRINP
ncbi:carboxylase [Longispora fulva]|uniref:Biotin carboxylase n=1 Tax=Longispora fulva TaxID=619741 RepID=A0A8J7KZP3_9ACTN|nr:ATP-grasp domain-containing protein [Longispora fulva]MBG6141422.1 biotin carboxylase [Longispora fulva]GIG59428.1 carboxylase [Longispora fulva]